MLLESTYCHENCSSSMVSLFYDTNETAGVWNHWEAVCGVVNNTVFCIWIAPVSLYRLPSGLNKSSSFQPLFFSVGGSMWVWYSLGSACLWPCSASCTWSGSKASSTTTRSTLPFLPSPPQPLLLHLAGKTAKTDQL